MNYQHSSFDYTSADFEKVALNRFRSLVDFLPTDCHIYRETWECSTVVCLDFIRCIEAIEIAQSHANLLINLAQELGLGNTLIFKVGNKVMGWKRLASSADFGF